MSGTGLANCRGRHGAVAVPTGLLLGLMIAVVLRPGTVSAHAILEGSSPAGNSVVRTTAAPHIVVLRFDEPVEIALGSVRVVAADGGRVDLGQVAHPHGRTNEVAAGLRSGLRTGTYLVMWRVVSADSHPVSGSFNFSIGRAGAAPTARAAPSDQTAAVGAGVARFAGYAALMCLVGALGFVSLCAPALWRDRRWLAFARGTVLVGIVALLSDLGLQAAQDLGEGVSGAWDAPALRAIAATQFGHARLLGVVLLAVVAVCLLPACVRRAGVLLRWAILGLAAAALATNAGAGHAGAGDAAWWRLPLDSAHLLAAGMWVGGLVTLVTMAIGRSSAPASAPHPRRTGRVLVAANVERPPAPTIGDGNLRVPSAPARRQRLDAGAVRRFSVVAATCVGVLVASGLVQAWYQVREWGALTGTHYGQLLIAKSAVVLAALGAAAFSRAWVRRHDTRVRVLLVSVGAETALAVCVLAITSVLVATTPAQAAYRPAVARTIQTGPVTVQLSTVPTAAHTVDLHLYTFNRAGLIVGVQALRLTATDPTGDQQAGTVVAPLRQVGPGHFIAPHWLLPAAGTWRVQLTVQTTQFDAFTAQTDLPVR